MIQNSDVDKMKISLNEIIKKLDIAKLNEDDNQQRVTKLFLSRTYDSTLSILDLTSNNKYYDANVLLSHLFDVIIQLYWIMKEPEKHSKDFLDFTNLGVIRKNKYFPENKEFDKDNFLKIIKDLDLTRFLKDKKKKHTNEELLNYENYSEYWHQEGSLKNITKELAKKEENKNLEMFYKLYRYSCNYKHIEPLYLFKYTNGEYNTEFKYQTLRSSLFLLLVVIDFGKQVHNIDFDIEKYLSYFKKWT